MADGAAILTVQGLAKSFGPRQVLRDVSFAVHPGDRIGLIGKNGGGKSTLMKMLVAAASPEHEAGALEPDGGLITCQRQLGLEYVAQEPRLDADRSIAEILARGGTVMAHEVDAMALALRLPAADTRVGTLSLGERRRVAIGKALLGHADLLALDEPTNHLDARTVEWLEQHLKARAGALILVTHDRMFLDRVATRILELDRGAIYAYEGDYSTFLERQAERWATEASHEQKRAAFVRRELEWIRRGPAARSTKQQARIDRFDAAVAARPSDDQRPDRALELILPTGGRLGKTILEVEGIGRTIGERTLFRDLSLTLKPGDRIAIIGDNGAGKTTLLRTLLGLDPPGAGKVVRGLNTSIVYLDQGRADLDDDHTVIEEVAAGNDHVFLDSGPIHVRAFLRMMLFADEAADTRIGDLSGGERNRVQLTKLLRRGGNFLVLDEPTNDLDLVTLGVLEQALIEFPGCVLVVSHDRWFVDRVATALLVFEGDGKVVLHEGNHADYQARKSVEARAHRDRAPKTPSQKAKKRPGQVPATGPKKLTFKERRELAGIEDVIGAAEAEVAYLEATLSDPEVFKDRGPEVPALVEKLDAARAEVDRLYARWQALEALSAAAPG